MAAAGSMGACLHGWCAHGLTALEDGAVTGSGGLVSVVVIFLDEAAFLEEAIASVLARPTPTGNCCSWMTARPTGATALHGGTPKRIPRASAVFDTRY